MCQLCDEIVCMRSGFRIKYFSVLLLLVARAKSAFWYYVLLDPRYDRYVFAMMAANPSRDSHTAIHTAKRAMHVVSRRQLFNIFHVTREYTAQHHILFRWDRLSRHDFLCHHS